MTNNGVFVQQPYEVIETEETITRYITTPSNHRACHSQSKNHPKQNSFKQDSSRNPRKNRQFQDLYEKFSRMRMVMLELTEKFKEINSDINTPAFDDSITSTPATGKSDRNKKNVEVDGTEFKNGFVFDSSITDCGSQVTIKSDLNTSRQILPNPNEIVDPETELFSTNRGTHSTPTSIYETVEAPMLRKSKKILINLIDKELHRVQSKRTPFVDGKSPADGVASSDDSKHLKLDCIGRMAKDLDMLRDLEGMCRTQKK